MSEQATTSQRPADVYFFATCVVDQFFPGAGMDAITLLERQGIRVHFPEDQTCCGQPAYTSGFPDAARKVAAHQLTLFPNDWPVVVPSGSCAGMMKHHYPTLFAADPARKAQAEALSGRIYEFTDFLVNVLGWQPQDKGSECTVVLHTSCSARREMGVHLTGRQLLGGLDKVKVAQQDHESECCGFGGTFSVKQPEISGAMVEDKVKALKATGAERVVSADCGCLMNILGHAAWKDEQAGLSQPEPARRAHRQLPVAAYRGKERQMSARDRILAKLRSAMPAENLAAPDVAGWYAGHRAVESSAEKAARFRNCIELAHAEVHAVSAANWLQDAVGSADRERPHATAGRPRHRPRPQRHRSPVADRHRLQALRSGDRNLEGRNVPSRPGQFYRRPRRHRRDRHADPVAGRTRAAPDVAGAAGPYRAARCQQNLQHVL